MKCELYHDNFQNFKRYNVPKAQLVIADIPYNIGADGGKHMVFDWFRWERDSRKEYPKIHPTQKPVGVLKRLIEVFTDPGDVVIDPVAGSGTTLRAAYELGRSAYGFEVDKSFYEAAREKMLAPILMEKTTI